MREIENWATPIKASGVSLDVTDCFGPWLTRSQHYNDRAHFHPTVEIDYVLVGQPDAARRNGMTNPTRLVGAVDTVQSVLVAGVKVNAPCAHRIVGSALDVVRKRAEPLLFTLGRRPSRPFFLAADLGDAGPSLRILADDRAVANRLAPGST